MDISFQGANCLVVALKHARVVIDDNLKELGATSVTKAGDIALSTRNDHPAVQTDVKLAIDGPGEYEVSGVSIYGLAMRAYTDEEGQQSSTAYKLVSDDIRLLALGHVNPKLSEAQLEQIGTVDILTLPVGGGGYTLDAAEALALIRQIEPKLVIPTHYADKSLNYPLAQAALTEALQGLAMEPKETVAKLRIKPAELTDTTQLVVLERS